LYLLILFVHGRLHESVINPVPNEIDTKTHVIQPEVGKIVSFRGDHHHSVQQFTVEQLEDMEAQNAPVDSSMERWSVVLEQYHLSPAYYNKTNRFGTMDGTDGEGNLWKDLSLLETHTYRDSPPEVNTPKAESSPSPPETLSIPSSSPAKPAHHHRAAELAAEAQRETDTEDADDDDDDHNDGDNRGGDNTKVSDPDIYGSYSSDKSAPKKESEAKMATEGSPASRNQTINYNATDTKARMLKLSKKVDDFIIKASRKQLIAASETGPVKVQVTTNEYVNTGHREL